MRINSRAAVLPALVVLITALAPLTAGAAPRVSTNRIAARRRNGEVIYSDSLKGEDGGWLPDTRALQLPLSIDPASNGFIVELDKAGTDAGVLVPAPKQWGDQVVTVDVTTPPPGTFPGVYCKANSLVSFEADEYYILYVEPSTGATKIGKFDGTNFTIIVNEQHPDLFQGDSMQLEASCTKKGSGVELSLSVNGKRAVQTTDSDHPLTGPGVGFDLATNDDGPGQTIATFSNFTLSDPSKGAHDIKPVAGKRASAPHGTVLVSDPMTKPSKDGFQPVDADYGTSQFTHGGYQVKTPEPGGAFTYTADKIDNALRSGGAVPTDVAAEVKAKKTAGGGAYYGVVCRNSQTGFYQLGIDADGLAVIRKYSSAQGLANNRYRVIASSPGPVRTSPKGANRILASCTGADGDPVHLALAVNGKTVLDVTDDQPVSSQGGIGVFSEREWSKSAPVVVFSDFKASDVS